MFWVAWPLIALAFLVLSLDALPESIRAARGEGLPGTFLAEREECSRRGCAWYGSFVSDDRMVSLDDVLLDVGGPEDLGVEVRVLYEGETDPPKVYLAEGSRDWQLVALGLLGSVGFLLWWLWIVSRLQASLRPASPGGRPPS
jgi:hypothetical protein